jgi:hypothetical protein
MKRAEYEAFCECRNNFRAITGEIEAALPDLRDFQQRLIDQRTGPRYNVDTPVVYNMALDDVDHDADIKLILVGDNPGRREQAAENRRYLVGPSGKIAESFFKREAALRIDFRKNVIILNKSPIHTPRTADLKDLCRLGGERMRRLIDASQTKMANLLADFFCALHIPIWITGYSEMKKRGVFERYTADLEDLVRRGVIDGESVFLYRHFSMNQFTIDLRQKMRPDESIEEVLRGIGAEYRERILSV